MACADPDYLCPFAGRSSCRPMVGLLNCTNKRKSNQYLKINKNMKTKNKVEKIKRVVLIPVAIAFMVVAACSPDYEQVSEVVEVEGEYPLEVCVVSGEELGSMGEPVVYDHEGVEVRFCCDACIPEFEEDPDRYLGEIEQARGDG